MNNSYTITINLNDSSLTDYFFDWNLLPDRKYKVYSSWICSSSSMGIGHRSGQYLQTNIFDGVYSNNNQILNSLAGATPGVGLTGYDEVCLIPFAKRPDDNSAGLYMSRRMRIDTGNPIIIIGRPRVNNFQVSYMTCFNNQNPIDVYTAWWDNMYGILQFKFVPIDE